MLIVKLYLYGLASALVLLGLGCGLVWGWNHYPNVMGWILAVGMAAFALPMVGSLHYLLWEPVWQAIRSSVGGGK